MPGRLSARLTPTLQSHKPFRTDTQDGTVQAIQRELGLCVGDFLALENNPALLDEATRLSGAFSHPRRDEQLADPGLAVAGCVGWDQDLRDLCRKLAGGVDTLPLGIRSLGGFSSVIDRDDLTGQPPLDVLGVH